MKHDPPMKKVKGEFVCAWEGCDKPLDELTVRNLDPFCSTGCCRAYYGIEIPMPGRSSL